MNHKYIWLLITSIILSITSCSFIEPKPNHAESYPHEPINTPIESLATETDQENSFAATLTASVGPIPTIRPTDSYSENRPVCFIDPFLGFSLMVASSWIASPWYDTNTGVSLVTLYNYNYNDPYIPNDIFSKGGIKVSLNVLDVEPDTIFDQYVEDRIKDTQFASENRLIITDPISYTLGAYSGIIFSGSGDGPDFKEIILQNGNRIAIIDLMPADSPALPQALSILSSLDLYNSLSCRN